MNNKKFSAIIIDDEQQDRELLSQQLNKHCPEIDIIGQFDNSMDGMINIHELKPKVIFLDIELGPPMNGIKMLKCLGKDNINFQTIFITKHSEFALEAIQLNACHYLIKPYTIPLLKEAVGRLKNIRPPLSIPDNQFLVLPPNGRKQFVFRIKNIICFIADANMVDVICSDRTERVVNIPLGDVTNLLSNIKEFERIHNSHTINLCHIRRLNRGERTVEMSNGEKMFVSRSYSWNKLIELLKVIDCD